MVATFEQSRNYQTATEMRLTILERHDDAKDFKDIWLLEQEEEHLQRFLLTTHIIMLYPVDS